jgi:hypothetical protein
MYELLDKECWSPIINLNQNEKCYYFISTHGRVFSLATNSFIIPHENDRGYLQVSLMTNDGRIFRKVHRLVMLTFCYFYGCEELQVNHRDGNKKNNNITNLEWVTAKQNVQHAIENNFRSSVGENNPKAKLNQAQVLQISNLIISGKSDDEICSIIGCDCTKEMIRSIAHGNTWRHLFTDEQLNAMLKTRKGSIFPTELKHSICKFYQDKASSYPFFNGRVKNIITDALLYHGLEVNQFNYNIVHRLYYRLQNPDITSLYNY